MAEKRKWLVTKVTVTIQTKEVRAEKATSASSRAKKQGKWTVTEDDVAYFSDLISSLPIFSNFEQKSSEPTTGQLLHKGDLAISGGGIEGNEC